MQISSKNFTLDFKKTLANAASIWQRCHMYVFFFLLFCAIFLGGYVWRQSISGEGWSQQKKQEYLSTQKKDIVFNEKDFKQAVENVQTRKDENASTYNSIKDIFEPYK